MTTAELTDRDWDLRADVYHSFIETGKAPRNSDLANALGSSVPDVEAGVQNLEQHHHIALAPGTTRVWMANPFSAIPTEYPSRTETVRYWANCAWDAVGVPAILGRDAWTDTRCAETGTPIESGVRNGRFVGGDEVIHIAVPARHFYDNIGYT